jgi:hypothetical protein
MKKSPGRALRKLLFVIVGITLVYANDFSYKFALSDTTPYLKEAVIMKLDLEQTDHSKVLLFKFSPKKSDDYEFYRLDMKEEDAYHAAKIHYTYLIYPKRTGEINITFNLIEMVTTDEKVAYSFSGDRDNVRGLNKKDIPIDLPPLKLNVKPLPEGTQIVGNFKLDYAIKKKRANAYEPLPITITIKGAGYPPVLKQLIPKNKNFSTFVEKPIIHTVRSAKDSRSTVTYSLALSAKKSFTLPEIKLRAFDPKTEKAYTLTIPKKEFTITEPDQSTLVDKIDSPKPLQSDWSWLGTLLGYLVAFIAGFLSAKSIKWRPGKKEKPSEDAWTTEMLATNNPKKLLALLIATDDRRYEGIIRKLEKSIYSKRGPSIKQIKNEIHHIKTGETL